MTSWIALAIALATYIGLLVLVGLLLRRHRRELNRQWEDLEAWERALLEASRERQRRECRGP